MRELNAAELLGLRTRVVWNLITETKPGCGNCAIPFALVALSRWEEVDEGWLTSLAQVYGVEILTTINEWVDRGSVEKIADQEGTRYRLALFPRGYEQLLTLVANEEPSMYRQALDCTDDATGWPGVKGKGSKGSGRDAAKRAGISDPVARPRSR